LSQTNAALQLAKNLLVAINDIKRLARFEACGRPRTLDVVRRPSRGAEIFRRHKDGRRRSRKPEEIGRRSRRALTHAVAHSQAVSIVHGRLIGSAFAMVVCLTLAKWETVSG